jgi:hypothetical protein
MAAPPAMKFNNWNFMPGIFSARGSRRIMMLSRQCEAVIERRQFKLLVPPAKSNKSGISCCGFSAALFCTGNNGR